MADDKMVHLSVMNDPRTFAPCHLVNAPVTDKDGVTRDAQGGWTHTRCLNCTLELWVPKGSDYTLPEVCRGKKQ